MLLIKKNLFFIIGIIILSAGLAGSLFFLKSTLDVRKKTTDKIDEQKIRIEKLKKFKHGPLSPQGVKKWKKQCEFSRNNFQRIIEIFDNPAAKMPVDLKGPLEFKEELFDQQIKITAKADRSGLKLPTNLGFEYLRNTIPQREDIPMLTKQLAIIQRLVQLMAESRISSLTKTAFIQPADKRVEGSERPCFYRDFGLTLSVVGETENIVNFLHLLEIDDFIFVVNDFAVERAQIPVITRAYKSARGAKKIERKMIQADLDISTYIYFFESDKGEKSES